MLDKFNCIGCHQVQPGIYEMDRTPQMVADLEDLSYQKNPKKFAAEFHDLFEAENEWTGRPSPFPDRLLVHAVPDPTSCNDAAPDRGSARHEEAGRRPQQG